MIFWVSGNHSSGRHVCQMLQLKRKCTRPNQLHRPSPCVKLVDAVVPPSATHNTFQEIFFINIHTYSRHNKNFRKACILKIFFARQVFFKTGQNFRWVFLPCRRMNHIDCYIKTLIYFTALSQWHLIQVTTCRNLCNPKMYSTTRYSIKNCKIWMAAKVCN